MKEKNQPLFSKVLKITYFIFCLYLYITFSFICSEKIYILALQVLKVLFMMVDNFLIVVIKQGEVRIRLQASLFCLI